jgi:hypothetical protein
MMELPFLNRNMDGLLPFAHSPIAEIPSQQRFKPLAHYDHPYKPIYLVGL